MSQTKESTEYEHLSRDFLVGAGLAIVGLLLAPLVGYRPGPLKFVDFILGCTCIWFLVVGVTVMGWPGFRRSRMSAGFQALGIALAGACYGRLFMYLVYY